MNLINKIKWYKYRFQWYISQYISLPYVTHIDIEINNNCNQKCIFCWHSEKKKKFKLCKMNHDIVFHYIKLAYDLGARAIKFNFRGEPAIHENLIEYAQYAKRIGFLNLMINTNATCNELTFSEILYYFDTIVISVDSYNKETYKKLHSSTEEQYQNLQKNLLFLAKNTFLNKKVEINIHLNKFNEKENFENYVLYKHNIKYTQNRCGEHIAIEQKQRKRKKYCPHMMRRLTILANEKIYPCCLSYLEPQDLQLNIDIKRLELKYIWNSPERKQLIKNYARGIYTESCKNCTSEEIYV